MSTQSDDLFMRLWESYATRQLFNNNEAAAYEVYMGVWSAAVQACVNTSQEINPFVAEKLKELL
jgi:hypothetical protein